MPISKTPRETISSIGNRCKSKTDLNTSYISTTSTSLVRSSATDETQQRKLILMFSSLRINAICALIPCEETKNSAFVFSVFALMLLRSSLKVILLFMLLVESVLTARNISLCPSLLSGSLK